MKSNFKHTHLFLSAFFIFSFGSCWAQKPMADSLKKIQFISKDSKNYLFFKKDDGSDFLFEHKLGMFCNISPTGKFVAIGFPDTSFSSTVKVFDNNFNFQYQIGKIYACNLRVSDWGGLVTKCAEGLTAHSYNYFDQNGFLIKKDPNIYLSSEVLFRDNLIVFLGVKAEETSLLGIINLLDNSFKNIMSYKLKPNENGGLYDEDVLLNITDNTIKVKIYDNTDTHYDSTLKKNVGVKFKSIIFNLSNSKVERREGWTN